MLNRNGAISMAVLAAVAAAANVALADSKTPTLTLEPTVAMLDDAPAPRAPLMAGLDRLGAAKTLDDLKLNIYGWVEGGYTYNHRYTTRESSVTPSAPKIFGGTFNHEAGDDFMLNQIVVRFERQVDTTKMDVGGMVELMYGEDAAAIHASGLGYNGNDSSESATDDRFHPNYHFDIVQAYLDIGVGVKGLKIRVGKFATILGYEYINPNQNPLYSHSYIFGALPFTQTGALAFYDINDQWHVAAGFTRGWDIATEDNNSCAIDFLGQIGYTPNANVSAYLNLSSGPQNSGDTGHYRTVIDPVVTWQVTKELLIGGEGLYLYDGGINDGSYGDAWGAAGYAAYTVNDYLTINGRIEKFHDYRGSSGVLASAVGSSIAGSLLGDSAVNYYEITLGVTIKPFPKDQFGSGLKIRPEVRYDFSDKSGGAIPGGNPVSSQHDQLTFGADVIYSF